MPCNLIEDFILSCRDGVSGIDQILLTEWDNVLSVTSSSGVVTAITKSSGKKFWVYQLEDEDADFKQSEKIAIVAGTNYQEQTLSFTMRKFSAKNRNNLRLLTQNKLMVIIKDNNGTYWLLGEVKGMRVTALEGGTGKAMGDLSGYTLTLMAKETLPANTVTSSIISALQS